MIRSSSINDPVKELSEFQRRQHQEYPRNGTIITAHGAIETPRLFPVINFIGGTTTNCGGMWKYTRKHIFDAQIPVMSEIMHFLDYHLSEKSLKNWRSKTFHQWFPHFKKPLFLDSGGYQLLGSKGLDLSGLNLNATPRDVLELQLDFGADMIATLDYPLPPNLKRKESQERIQLTIENAIAALRLLEKRGDTKTLVFVPVHGRTPTELEFFIHSFLKRYRRARLERQFDGFAVGSLVPLRNNPILVAELLWTAKRVFNDLGLGELPLHVFGVGSDMIPFLIYLGFDTFDSSSYAQNARTLRYADPETWVSHRATQLREINCSCSACQQIDPKEMRGVLTSDISFQAVNGRFKSEFYALIAMHNLNLHLTEVKLSTQAARSGELENHLVEFALKHPRTKRVLEFLASRDSELSKLVGRTIHPVKHSAMLTQRENLSLKYRSKDFTIPRDYRVPNNVRILFLFPCSKQKPYSTSQTFRRISKGITKNLNGLSQQIHFVVVSGLYGPVPLQYDKLPQIRNYDFVLSFMNKKAIALVSERLLQYIEKYGDRFDYIIALATSKQYRKAIENGLKETPRAQIFPKLEARERIGKNKLDQLGLKESMQFLQTLEKEQSAIKSKIRA